MVDILWLLHACFRRANSVLQSPASLLGETEVVLSGPEGRGLSPWRDRRTWGNRWVEDRKGVEREAKRESNACPEIWLKLPWESLGFFLRSLGVDAGSCQCCTPLLRHRQRERPASIQCLQPACALTGVCSRGRKKSVSSEEWQLSHESLWRVLSASAAAL